MEQIIRARKPLLCFEGVVVKYGEGWMLLSEIVKQETIQETWTNRDGSARPVSVTYTPATLLVCYKKNPQIGKNYEGMLIEVSVVPSADYNPKTQKFEVKYWLNDVESQPGERDENLFNCVKAELEKAKQTREQQKQPQIPAPAPTPAPTPVEIPKIPDPAPKAAIPTPTVRPQRVSRYSR